MERTSTSGRYSGVIRAQALTFRVGFKPPATISQEQSTARYDGSSGVLAAKGRHDPCVVPRAVPIVETMAALVIME
jgi:chorismate synthase